MPTFTGEEKNKIIALLNEREVKFYHACQYKDFKAYAQLGGIPSRLLMEQSQLDFTAFDTDNADHTNRVWDKVFGNLQDSGMPFAHGKINPQNAPTPNAFGPILLMFNPEVFEEATDVAICLRSAGGENFNREIESLSTVSDVNKLFQLEDISKASGDNPFEKSNLKFTGALKKVFNNPHAATPEVSCSVPGQLLSFNHLWGVRVDPYEINKLHLFDQVRSIKFDKNIDGWIKPRSYADDMRLRIKQELGVLLIDSLITLPEIIAHPTASDDLKDWANRLQVAGRGFYFNRFAKYLRNGTILKLKEESEEQPDSFDLSSFFNGNN